MASGNRVAVAAGVDDEVAKLGLRAGPAQRTVQRHVTGLIQNGFKPKLIDDAEC